MLLDLADLQWWQGVAALLAILGLSPAPWILGLAFNRIQFTRPAEAIYNERIADAKKASAEAIEIATTASREVVDALVKHHADLVAVKDANYLEVKAQRDEIAAAMSVLRTAYSELAGEVVDVVKEVSALAGTTLSASTDTPQDRGTN